jgi:hypothetical protein
MIPIEYLWGVLMLVFAVIGMVRGLWRELGVTTIVLLSLFALHVGQELIVDNFAQNPPLGPLVGAPDGTIYALYYGVTICFVAFISYQGITLEFPVKKQGGLFKWFFGFFGGLLNGYLIVGTIWNVISNADYFGWIPSGAVFPISSTTTQFYNRAIEYLPVSLMNSNDFVPYTFLVLGMILLLAIILK